MSRQKYILWARFFKNASTKQHNNGWDPKYESSKSLNRGRLPITSAKDLCASHSSIIDQS